VFTLTQLTAVLADDPTAESGWRVVLIFVVLFWMYGGYVWLTNQVPPDRPARRLLLITGMAAFLVCALAIPEAFDGGGIAFGLGYLLVVLVHAGLYGQVYGNPVVLRFAPFNVISALSVTAAGFLDGIAAYSLWLAAIFIQFATPFVAARAAPRFAIRSAHFVERHGLLWIVAFGESVVAIGIGIGDVSLDLGVFAAAAGACPRIIPVVGLFPRRRAGRTEGDDLRHAGSALPTSHQRVLLFLHPHAARSDHDRRRCQEVDRTRHGTSRTQSRAHACRWGGLVSGRRRCVPSSDADPPGRLPSGRGGGGSWNDCSRSTSVRGSPARRPPGDRRRGARSGDDMAS